MSNGKFVDLVLDYNKHSNLQLAEILLNQAEARIRDGAIGVGYIYSANYGQTREIQKTYFSNQWNTHTSGINQAGIVMAVEAALGSEQYQKLREKVHILPITTMNAYTNPIANWNDQLHLGILHEDLDRVEYYLKSSWDVFGIQDPKFTTEKPYAIGGQVAKMDKAVSSFIQKILIQLKSNYLV